MITSLVILIINPKKRTIKIHKEKTSIIDGRIYMNNENQFFLKEPHHIFGDIVIDMKEESIVPSINLEGKIIATMFSTTKKPKKLKNYIIKDIDNVLNKCLGFYDEVIRMSIKKQIETEML